MKICFNSVFFPRKNKIGHHRPTLACRFGHLYQILKLLQHTISCLHTSHMQITCKQFMKDVWAFTKHLLEQWGLAMSICLIHRLECYGNFSSQICGFLQAPDKKGWKGGCVRYYFCGFATSTCQTETLRFSLC